MNETKISARMLKWMHFIFIFILIFILANAIFFTLLFSQGLWCTLYNADFMLGLSIITCIQYKEKKVKYLKIFHSTLVMLFNRNIQTSKVIPRYIPTPRVKKRYWYVYIFSTKGSPHRVVPGEEIWQHMFL